MTEANKVTDTMQDFEYQRFLTKTAGEIDRLIVEPKQRDWFKQLAEEFIEQFFIWCDAFVEVEEKALEDNKLIIGKEPIPQAIADIHGEYGKYSKSFEGWAKRFLKEYDNLRCGARNNKNSLPGEYKKAVIATSEQQILWHIKVLENTPKGYKIHRPEMNRWHKAMSRINCSFYGAPLPPNPLETLFTKPPFILASKKTVPLIERRPDNDQENLRRQAFLLAVIHANISSCPSLINPKCHPAEEIWNYWAYLRYKTAKVAKEKERYVIEFYKQEIKTAMLMVEKHLRKECSKKEEYEQAKEKDGNTSISKRKKGRKIDPDADQPEIIKVDLGLFYTGPSKKLLQNLILTPKGVAGTSQEAKDLRAALRDNKGDEYEKVAKHISKIRNKDIICVDTEKITLKAKE